MISGSFRINNRILDWPGFQPGGIGWGVVDTAISQRAKIKKAS